MNRFFIFIGVFVPCFGIRGLLFRESFEEKIIAEAGARPGYPEGKKQGFPKKRQAKTQGRGMGYFTRGPPEGRV